MNKKNTYDCIISIGRDCACSLYLRDNNLQRKSYPFDWLTHNNTLSGCLDIRLGLILNDFKDFMNIEDFKLLEKDPNIPNDNNCDYYVNKRNSLYFYHDFPKGVPIKESFPQIKQKYERRINRLYQSIQENAKVLFVWFAHQPNISDKEIIKYSGKINKKFGKKIDIIVFENDNSLPSKDVFGTKYLSDCIIKYTLNTYPEFIKDKTKGNVELCNKVFKLYSLNESFFSAILHAFYKILRKSIRLGKRFYGLLRKIITKVVGRVRKYFCKSSSLPKAIASLKFIPNIKSSEETIETLLDNSTSISRFGDGEFSLIDGNDIPFQKSSPELTSRLKEILQSNESGILIGINYYFWNYRKSEFKIVEDFHNTWAAENLPKITSLLHRNKTYYNSTFTTPFTTFKNHDFNSYYEKIKHIWRDKNITIICGKTVFDKIKVNIFDCAKSINFIHAKSKNAFEDYDELIKKAKKIDKNRLVVLILGPTATILAYDLAKLGYKALDIGHIAKDYDWFYKYVKHNNKTLQDFYSPD